MMKKTLLITLEYPPMIGGVAHYYKNLVEKLPQDRVLVCTNEQNTLVDPAFPLWPKWLTGILTVRNLVKQNQIEHILVGQILPLGTIALILNLTMKVPYTVMTHAMDVTVPFGPKGSAVKRWLMRVILRRAESVTSVSTYTKMQLESLLNVAPKKIEMIYPCPHHNGTQYSAEQLHAMAKQIDQEYNLVGKQVLLSVGRLVERKGVDFVLAALSHLRERQADVEYVIVGDGPYRARLESLARQFGVADRVRFIGAATDEEVAQWFARCNAFIMPSRELKNRDVEGFGIVFVEANSFGKPVIGGKSGGVIDAVVDGENGYLVNADDIDMIARAIDRLMRDRPTAERLGLNGRSRVVEFFQWDLQAKKMEELLSYQDHVS